MGMPIPVNFVKATAANLSHITTSRDQLVLCISHDGQLSVDLEFLDKSFPALSRCITSENFSKLKDNEQLVINFPIGLETDKVVIHKLPADPTPATMREAGGAIGELVLNKKTLVHVGAPHTAHVAEGIALRAYKFNKYKTEKKDESSTAAECTVLCRDADKCEESYKTLACGVEGAHFTRDLVNEPANSLTTTEFAHELQALESMGLKVKVLDEAELASIGMRTLLAVGQGSASPSKVAVIEWNGGKGKPYAVVGKGVCFDTGGISLKPAKGMEQMTMDMAGAGVVAGVMKAVARARAGVNVVGVVGLVENMPGDNAQRPGDIVKSLKGDTVEVLNTDAEGRLVLADLLWYTQERFKPKWMINLATLTGAIIVSLGHEYAGLFSNDDKLTDKFLAAAELAGEKAWRQPLDDAYDKQLESRLADMKNIGGQYAGAITAAQFLQRFVKSDCPWIHLDIAGVAFPPKPGAVAPKGPSGWGVRSIYNLICSTS